MIPGRIENINLIVDCNRIGLFNAPYLSFKHVVDVISEYYKAKLTKIYCLNSSSSLSAAWKSLSQVSPLTLNKIQYCNQGDNLLKDHISKN